MKSNLGKQILLLALPLLCKYFFFLVFVDLGVFDAEDLKEDIIFFSLVAIFVQIKFFQKQIFKDMLLFVYLFYMVLETTSYLAVSSTFSSSYMYLLLESGSEELSEFANGYFNFPILAVFIINIFLFFVLRKVAYNFNFKYSNLTGFASLFVIMGLLKFTGLIESNAYHNAVRGTYGYYQLQKNMTFASSLSKDEITVSSDNETMVLVLGESTDRNHMQIYGYDLKTTPKLNSITDELLIYDNVISNEVFTLKAVPKILTSLDDKANAEALVDIVQVFKAAGFDTYWLSNQRPISYHDNAISVIASRSKKFKFYNHQIDRDASALDEVILPDYLEILNQPGKKLIVLRLLGTHFDYKNRYPEAYNKFDVSDVKTKKQKLTNQYNNAVLYNDFILHSIIESLKQKNQKSALLYISDHGENIYNNGTDFFGRSEEIITKNMFTIPFVFWKSNTFEMPIDFEYKKSRPFTSQFTYESLGHIFGIKHQSMDFNKSIFSKNFKADKRTVVGNRDFDKYFETKE